MNFETSVEDIRKQRQAVLDTKVPSRQQSLNLRGKTFLLGIGAQRCGTTWLFEYLDCHPNITLPPIKEVHYFDQVLKPKMSGYWAKKFEQALDNHLSTTAGQELTEWQVQLRHWLVDRLKMNYDRNAYLNAFARMVSPETLVVGEITPAYCLLDRHGFAQVRSLLVDHGLRPKVLFIMRDPAERTWSQLRLVSSQRGPGSCIQRAELVAALENQQFLQRTYYDATIKSLKAVFPTTELHFEFYENLFNDDTIGRICKFVGVQPHRSIIPERIHPAPQNVMSSEFRTLLRDTFAHVYAFCDAEFGGRVPSNWRQT